MAMIPETLANLNLFVDGTSFQGDVTSLTLPKLTLKMEEHRVGGMDMPIEMDMGMEKQEAGFTTTGVRRESLKFFGLADGSGFNGTFRGAFKGLKGAITPVIVTLRGALKEVDMGDWKAGDKAEIKHTVAVTYYKLEVGGRLIYEIDPVGMKRVIDGVDQLAAQRSALGLEGTLMTQAKIPGWLKLSADGVVVTLTKPSEANGIQVDSLSLRSPTVRDIRAAQSASGDDEQRELNLFASLAEVGVKDLEGLALKDYSRLQAGYFRLVQDDEL